MHTWKLSRETSCSQQGTSSSSISRSTRSQGDSMRILPSVYSTEEPGYFERYVAVTLWNARGRCLTGYHNGLLWDRLEAKQLFVKATVTRPRFPSRAVLHRQWSTSSQRRLRSLECRLGRTPNSQEYQSCRSRNSRTTRTDIRTRTRLGRTLPRRGTVREPVLNIDAIP